jgi:hypothetical protein
VVLPLRVHGVQGVARRAAAAVARCTSRPASSALRPMPRRKVISRDCPGASSSGTWIAAQGSSAAPLRPDRCMRRSAAGRRSEPLRPMNSARSQVSVPARSVAGVDVEEADPVAEVVAVAVARVERAGVGVDFGVDVRRRLRAQVAEHPFDVAGDGQPPRSAAVVAQQQARELHRFVHRDEHRQLAVDAGLVVLEHAVAEAVPRDVGRGALSSIRSPCAGSEVGSHTWPVSSSRR